MLIVVSGLPGVGKTTVARRIAERLRAVHLSVDAVEDGLLEAGLRPGRTTGVAAYEAVATAARQHLSLGNDVVVDAVNDGDEARATWRRAAADASVELRFFVLLPPSEAEHQRRLRGATGVIGTSKSQPGRTWWIALAATSLGQTLPSRWMPPRRRKPSRTTWWPHSATSGECRYLRSTSAAGTHPRCVPRSLSQVMSTGSRTTRGRWRRPAPVDPMDSWRVTITYRVA